MYKIKTINLLFMIKIKVLETLLLYSLQWSESLMLQVSGFTLLQAFLCNSIQTPNTKKVIEFSFTVVSRTK